MALMPTFWGRASIFANCEMRAVIAPIQWQVACFSNILKIAAQARAVKHRTMPKQTKKAVVVLSSANVLSQTNIADSIKQQFNILCERCEGEERDNGITSTLRSTLSQRNEAAFQNLPTSHWTPAAIAMVPAGDCVAVWR